MPINPSIAMGYRAPRIQQPDPEAEMTRGLQLKSLLMQQRAADDARADDQAQREAFRSSGGDEAAYLKALVSSGNTEGYYAALKAKREREAAEVEAAQKRAQTGKTAAETAGILTKNDAEKLAQHNNLLAGVASVDDGRAWVQLGLQSGAIKKENAPMIMQTFERAQTPEQLRDVVNRLSLGMKDYIEKNKPTYQTRNTGGSTDTISMPGLGGPVSVVNSVTNTQSPDNAASNARMAADAKAARDQAERHFSVNKDIQREKLDWEKSQGSGGKPLTDAQSKANLFGTRMLDSHKILNDLDGKYWPAAVNSGMAAEKMPIVGGIAGAAANAMLTDEGQRATQAMRNFINAVLRRESGAVISPSEFAEAAKQYFPQPNDTPANIKQKRQNRERAIDGLRIEVPGGQFRSSPTLSNPSAGDLPNGAEGGWNANSDPLGLRR